ncbi:DNA-binding transcriptional regulator OxyR [Legionella geestiana]|uniref:DNA-binding transcriptional regulator OxyR n=1 Tax=Legionella geestiana TaxID=45065 RepID=UPI0010931D11|nr:DNA-binding transcriptional regulator OxyR [Legionella geestiana]QDQ38906.1 DNA-binding transcriptional regulator OxyR [Legionella geestiana]
MNVRDLKYLVALANHNHFGRAAEACFVSQPALSIQIKKLEESLGVLIIERTNKKFFFTEIGKLIVEQARDVLHRVETLQEIAKQSSDPCCGELHLGIIPTLAPYLLPLIIPEISILFPKLTLYLIEETTSKLLTKINEGEIDGALLALPVKDNVSFRPVFDEEFVLALPLGHPLSKLKTVNFSDLENKTLILLEDGHCLREQALVVCHKAYATELKSFRATSLETLRHMVASGVGITLMPKLACRPNDGVCYIPFSSPVPRRTIGLIFRETTAKKNLMEQLAESIKTIRVC